jgi:hypothetical protein
MSELYTVHHHMKYNILANDSVTELTMERVRLAMIEAAQRVFDEDLGRYSFILTFEEDGKHWQKSKTALHIDPLSLFN